MTNTKDIGVIVVLLFVIGFIAVDFSGKVSSSVVENTDVSEPYSLEGLATEYEDRLALDENDKDALFSLARIYYIGNQTEKSLTAIAQYKERYPEEKRIYYISGLANAYGGNLRVAELEFLEFIDSGLSRWPGYLDLAWVYFQQGEFDQSQEKLDIALENFGSNMWLNTSRGAVALVFDNNLWIMGGAFSNDEVWTSTDGNDWSLVTDSPGWAGRGFFGGHYICTGGANA